MNFKRIVSRVFLLFFAFSVSILLLCLFSDKIAYLVNFSVAFFFRRWFAYLFSPLDFSIFEVIVLALPLLLFVTVRYISRAGTAEDARRRFILFISLFSIIPSSYVFMIAIPNTAQAPFYTECQPLEDEDFFKAAKLLAEGVNELSDKAQDVSYEFLSRAMAESYSALFCEFSIAKLPVAKPIVSSKLLSYTGALALYSPPTGEININTEIPTYMTPFTLAHEYAHYLGIGREGDANLFAFACCEKIADASVRYSARLTALEYILSDLYKVDREMYINIYNSLGFQAKADIKEHREYSEKYESLGILRFFDGLNTAHGAVWDGDGQGSYSATAKKIVQYLKNNQNIAN